MTWGGLNPALTAWRTAVMRRFPGKDTASDGGRADNVHGATSQHQADADGTVDAYDCDDDLRHPLASAGSSNERRLQQAMKEDFEQDPHDRGQLWIHNRLIANRDVGDWRQRTYTGSNPHDKHIHFETRQSRESIAREWPMPRTDAVIAELEGKTVTPEQIDAGITRYVSRIDRAVRGHEDMTETDKQDRAALARVIRFGLGYNHTEQLPLNLPPARFAELAGGLAEFVWRLDQILERLTAIEQRNSQ